MSRISRVAPVIWLFVLALIAWAARLPGPDAATAGPAAAAGVRPEEARI